MCCPSKAPDHQELFNQLIKGKEHKLHDCDDKMNKLHNKIDTRGGSINQKLNFGKKQNMAIIDEESTSMSNSQY
jgi:hypothetical protein